MSTQACTSQKVYWRESVREAIRSVREGRLPREVIGHFWRRYKAAARTLNGRAL